MALRNLLFIVVLALGISVQSIYADTDTGSDGEAAYVFTAQLSAMPLIPEIARPIVVCASGIGGVVCEFRFETRNDIQILERLCATGELPASVCDAFNVGATVAQVPAVCPVLVGFSREKVGELCSDVSRNEFCYGYEEVSVSPAVVTRSGDTAELTPITSINAQAYDLLGSAFGVGVVDGQSFGIGVINAHANLPVAMTDSAGLRVILFGGMQMSNRVSEGDAINLPEDALVATAQTSTSVFDVPPSFGEQTAVGTVAAGEALMVDALSDDGEWARVMFSYDGFVGVQAAGWVSFADLDFAQPGAVGDLPSISEDEFTPFQNFFFAPAGGVPPCQPITGGALILQSPEGVETTYIANDAQITIIGSAKMNIVGSRMEITVLSGVAVLEGGVIVPAGYTSRINVIPSQGFFVVAPNAEWDEPRALTRSEIDSVTYFESLPLSILNQAVNVPVCGPDSVGTACDITYDYEFDETLAADLCERGILSEELDICQ